MPDKIVTVDRIDGALEHIARAEGAASLELAFLEAAPRVIDLDACGMYTLDGAAHVTSVRVADVPRGFVPAYEEFGRPNDSLFRHIAAHGVPVHDRVLFGPAAWQREPIGRILGEFGFVHTSYAPVPLDGMLAATLHFGRFKPGRPFRQADLRNAALVARHVAQQLRWIQTEHELGRMRGLCASLLEQIAEPAVVTTEAGTLVEANDAAEAMLLCYRTGPQLWDEYAGAVRRNAREIAAGGSDRGGSRAARTASAELTYRVRTTPVERSDLLLSLFHPSVGGSRSHRALAGRDQAIACLVAEGHTNDRIALILDISVNTVKDRLKAINRKLGTANRVQIAAWAQRNQPPAGGR